MGILSHSEGRYIKFFQKNGGSGGKFYCGNIIVLYYLGPVFTFSFSEPPPYSCCKKIHLKISDINIFQQKWRSSGKFCCRNIIVLYDLGPVSTWPFSNPFPSKVGTATYVTPWKRKWKSPGRWTRKSNVTWNWTHLSIRTNLATKLRYAQRHGNNFNRCSVSLAVEMHNSRAASQELVTVPVKRFWSRHTCKITRWEVPYQ